MIFLYSMFTTYDRPLAVIMPHAETNTNPTPKANLDPNPNCAIIN